MKNVLKKIGRVLFNIFEMIVILYVVLITSCILCRNKYGFTQFGQYTLEAIKQENAEYFKEYKSGDLLVIKNAGVIELGDVIYYYDVIADQYVIREGEIKKIVDGDTVSLYTVEDNGRTVNSTKVIGKYVTAYSNWGLVLNILVSRIGFLILVLLPIMIIFVYQIYEFYIMIKYENDSDEETPKKKNNSKELEII